MEPLNPLLVAELQKHLLSLRAASLPGGRPASGVPVVPGGPVGQA